MANERVPIANSSSIARVTENPYQAPTAELPAGLPLWRRVLGVILRISSVQAGALAILMSAAGINWLRIEVTQGLGLSLSVALLTGAAISAAVCAGLARIAVLVGGSFSWLATLLIIGMAAFADLVAFLLLLLSALLPR